MNLTLQAIHDVVHPTAIFCAPDNDNRENGLHENPRSWESSQLNPKNRIHSLDPPKNPLWKIDGCAALGTQFYAVPLFLQDLPPMRIDVLISEDAFSPILREILDMDVVFHTRDRIRLQQQGICSYVLRALQAWTVREGRPKIKDLFVGGSSGRNLSFPFGSRIIFENLPLKVEDVNICIHRNNDLQKRHKSVMELAQMWKGTPLPPTIDIDKLVFVKQLHDSVCVVRYGGSESAQSGLWVLKALTSSLKFMYHELRILLTMPPHPSIVSRPNRLVTERSDLNEKRQNVVGFLLPFYSGGGLRDELPIMRIHNSLQIKDQARWSKDICSGLIHIQATTFYPDLRLDQIVFPADEKRPIIVDFEQRGVWCEFGAPEISAIDYLMTLAVHEEEDDATGDLALRLDGSWPNVQRFRDIVDRLYPDCRKPCAIAESATYNNPPLGYNVPWNSLTKQEQEYAEVYMLGRLMWCVWEGMSAPQRGAIWQSYRNEPEFDFPEYRRTPPELRELIDQCTRGRRGQLSSLVIRRGSKIVLRDDPRGDGTEQEIKAVAKEFWMNEVRWAETFVLKREKDVAAGTWDNNHFGRPTLREVEKVLIEFQARVEAGDIVNGA